MMNRKVFSSSNLKKILNLYFNKQVNRIIIVLIILLGIYIIKLVNINSTNRLLDLIEKNIYYNFSLVEDGRKLKDSLIKLVNTSKGRLEELAETMVNR